MEKSGKLERLERLEKLEKLEKLEWMERSGKPEQMRRLGSQPCNKGNWRENEEKQLNWSWHGLQIMMLLTWVGLESA